MNVDYRYGVTGYVHLDGDRAHKHMLFTEMYWLREYANLLRLRPFNHSNIIKYDSGSYVKRIPPKGPDKNKLYYELTFPRYHKTLRHTTVYNDEMFIQLALDLFSAIELMHSQNIWHRDIKGDNIMVTNDNRAMIIDFTHSIRLRTAKFTLDTSVETFTHRAPEVYTYVQNPTANTYNEKIDIWSLGIMMFEMITDKCFSALMTADNTEEEVEVLLEDANYMKYIEEKYFQNKRTLFWAKQYWQWIKKCLVYDPSKRISAKDMVEVILKFVTDKKINIKLPTWENPNIRNLQIEDKEIEKKTIDPIIYNMMCKDIKKYFELYSINVQISKLGKVIAHIMKHHVVNKETYVVTNLALTSILLTLVYDVIDDVPDTISYLCTSTGQLKIKHGVVYKKIIQLIQKHDKDLFLYDKFDF